MHQLGRRGTALAGVAGVEQMSEVVRVLHRQAERLMSVEHRDLAGLQIVDAPPSSFAMRTRDEALDHRSKVPPRWPEQSCRVTLDACGGSQEAQNHTDRTLRPCGLSLQVGIIAKKRPAN